MELDGDPQFVDSPGPQFVDAPGPQFVDSSGPAKTKSGWLMDKVNQAKAWAESRRPKTLKDALLKGIGNAGLGVPPVGDIPFLPNQTVAGAAKGLSDLVLGPTQLASHITGVGTDSVDKAVNSVNDYYTGNFDKADAGVAAGKSLTSLLPGSGAAMAFGKSVLDPILFTPEANLKPDEYASRKKTEGVVGAAAGAAVPVAGAALRGAKNLSGRIARTPAVQEFLDNLQAKFGIDTPGEYLKKKAISVYEKPLAKHDALMAEVGTEAPKGTTDYANTLKALNATIDDYNANPSQARPDQIEQLIALRDRIQKAVTPRTTATNVNPDFYTNPGSAPTVTASDGGSEISNDLSGAIRAYQDLGSPLGALLGGHKNRLSRGVLQDVRAAILDDVYGASPELSGKWGEARDIFRNEVVPLFDKRQGGNLLTGIRDAWDPNDKLKSLLQGGLRDAKVDKITKVAEGAAAEPLQWQAVRNALDAANNRPGGFAVNLNKAMPALEGISSPDTMQQLKDMIFAARLSQVGGKMADVGVGTGLAAAGKAVGMPELGAVAGVGLTGASHFVPAFSGQGLTWNAVQNPKVRSMFSKIAGLPENSPEFDQKIAEWLATVSGPKVSQ